MDIESIMHGNAVFRSSGEHHGITIRPRRNMLIIACADPRVDPERVLGMRLGDAAIIRNIGGRVTAPTLATVAGLGRVGARTAQDAGPQGNSGLDVLVIHHTDCGILRLNEDPGALAGYLSTDLEQLAGMHVTDPRASVTHDVAVLRGRKLPGARIWGLVYDVATGLIEIEVSGQEAHS